MGVADIRELFERGIELFNDGRFFECHEVWEQAWLRSSGEPKLFYQGMIQAAVAILHSQRGNLAGSRTLWAKARDKLEGLPAEYNSIVLGSLRIGLAEFFDQVLSGANTAVDPPKIERITH
jgi:predicted metal-dependent hydrolase